jgi:hypothetical protein
VTGDSISAATSVGSKRAGNNTAWPTAVTSRAQKGANHRDRQRRISAAAVAEG